MLAPDILNSRLRLRCLDASDATQRYLSWMLDPEINQYLESRFAEHSVESLKAFIESTRESSHSILFGIESIDRGIHHGNIKLGPINPHHSSASIGLFIGDREAWGRGYATEAISLVSAWAFDELGLSKLYAGAYASNPASVAAFVKNGYEVEGTQRSHVSLASGKRDDVVLVGRTR